MWLIIMLFVSLNYANPVQHGEWDALVKKHVSKNGMVDYQGFLKDKKQLQVYLDKLSANKPTSKWSKNEKMAFWINAYNAFTVKLILDHYPIKKFGSQGQQKSFLIALKLAQFEFVKKNSGENPILLFDDIFDKLDETRVGKIIEMVNNSDFGQLFISDTHPERTEAIIKSTHQSYKIFNFN